MPAPSCETLGVGFLLHAPRVAIFTFPCEELWLFHTFQILCGDGLRPGCMVSRRSR